MMDEAQFLEHFEERIDAAKAAQQNFQDYLRHNQAELERVRKGLACIADIIIDIRIDGLTSVDVNIAGNTADFNRAWTALRVLGYEPVFRPEEGKKYANFTTFWNRQQGDKYDAYDMKIYLNFSSTTCKLVRTGEETTTRPVYEIICSND